MSQATGNKTYAAHIQTVTNQLKKTQSRTALPGMWPMIADCSGSELNFTDKRFSLGVLAGKIISVPVPMDDHAECLT